MECKKIVFIIALYTKFYKKFFNKGPKTGTIDRLDSIFMRAGDTII